LDVFTPEVGFFNILDSTRDLNLENFSFLIFCLVFFIWFLDLGSWFYLLGSWFLVLFIWILVLGSCDLFF